MTNWPPDLDLDDVIRIEVVRFVLGTMAGVEQTRFDVYLRDGTVLQRDVPMSGIAYETLRDTVATFNRSRRQNRDRWSST